MISLAFFRTAAAAQGKRGGGRTRKNIAVDFHPTITGLRAGIASKVLLPRSDARDATIADSTGIAFSLVLRTAHLRMLR